MNHKITKIIHDSKNSLTHYRYSVICQLNTKDRADEAICITIDVFDDDDRCWYTTSIELNFNKTTSMSFNFNGHGAPASMLLKLNNLDIMDICAAFSDLERRLENNDWSEEEEE